MRSHARVAAERAPTRLAAHPRQLLREKLSSGGRNGEGLFSESTTTPTLSVRPPSAPAPVTNCWAPWMEVRGGGRRRRLAADERLGEPVIHRAPPRAPRARSPPRLRHIDRPYELITLEPPPRGFSG